MTTCKLEFELQQQSHIESCMFDCSVEVTVKPRGTAILQHWDISVQFLTSWASSSHCDQLFHIV